MKIYFSPLAEKKLNLILAYLEKEWSKKIKNEFLDILKNKFNQISQFPQSCINSQIKPEIYNCIVTSQTSFYYRIIKEEIEIITFFDNRQDSEQIFKEIKQFFV